MKQADSIVVIEIFSSAVLAGLAKAQLDAHGVPCFLTQEDVAGIYPLPFAAVRLNVFSADAVRAKNILNSTEATQEEGLANSSSEEF